MLFTILILITTQCLKTKFKKVQQKRNYEKIGIIDLK